MALDLGHHRAGVLQLASLPPLALYVHLPWCLRKCPYCDFNSHEKRPDAALQRQYVGALVSDLETALPSIWGRQVSSIFIGGGTPSLFEPAVVDELLAAVRARLNVEPGCEITLEANPGSFERDRFAAFRAAGVTRLSVGVQSFDDAALLALGRVHNSAQAHEALDEAARCFSTFNIDIMYALPRQSLEGLLRDLHAALAYKPPHVSIYHLTLEPNTRFAKYPPDELPDDDLAADMLDAIVETTRTAGLGRYEVSAFAREGHACQHNRNYWRFGDYLGIGAGAHSKLSFAHRIVREVRWRDPLRYVEQALAGSPQAQTKDLALADLPFEFMLNALRLREGFEVNLFSERTGLAFTRIEAAIDAGIQKGWLDRDLARIWPTRKGFDFLNDLQCLFLPDQ